MLTLRAYGAVFVVVLVAALIFLGVPKYILPGYISGYGDGDFTKIVEVLTLMVTFCLVMPIGFMSPILLYHFREAMKDVWKKFAPKAWGEGFYEKIQAIR